MNKLTRRHATVTEMACKSRQNANSGTNNQNRRFNSELNHSDVNSRAGKVLAKPLVTRLIPARTGSSEGIANNGVWRAGCVSFPVNSIRGREFGGANRARWGAAKVGADIFRFLHGRSRQVAKSFPAERTYRHRRLHPLRSCRNCSGCKTDKRCNICRICRSSFSGFAVAPEGTRFS